MPLANWGGGTDPSGVFAQLAAGVEDSIRAAAERLDARRESELAAQDEEFYARYQAGKVSDDDWLDYIRRRRAETEYDPEQSAAWRKAELEWTEKIADDRAAAAFENTGDYGDYIGYLQGKLRRTKDSDGRLAITSQIRQLQDEHSAKVFARGEQRIVDQIGLGKATQEDLLRFYREQRGNLRSGSPLRDTVNQRIRQTQIAIEQQRFEGGIARIDAALAGNHITPKEAARQKQELLNGSSLKQTDPGRYWAMVAEIDKLRYAPDPADIARLEFQLNSGAMSPDDYTKAMYEISDRLMDHDPTTAWQLRSQALANATSVRADLAKDKIPFPEYLGGGAGGIQVGPKGSAEFRWLSQMDGSQYAATNCTMASGAMIAYAMGYKGLSGGDLRYLTGDTVGGTNLDQLMFALGKAGVDTSGMNQFTGGAFEKLKQAVGNGRPAVLMGSNANLPIEARADPSHQGRHALLIAEYDAKKDAFLVYNSAVKRGDKRSKNGYWVSADAIEAFGWGGGLSVPGQFILSPKGTATPGKRRALHVIDVDTPPMQRRTPKSYVGRDNPGASGNQRAHARSRGVIKPPPTTMTEVKEREDEAMRRLDTIDEMVAAYSKGETEFGGVALTPELMMEMDRETLTIFDEQIAFSQASGDFGQAGTIRDRRGAYIKGVKERSGAGTQYLFNTLLRDARSDLEDLTKVTDINERNRRIAKMAERFRTFANARTGGKGDLAGVDPETDALVNTFADAFDTAADPSVPAADKAKAISDAVDAIGGTLPADFKQQTGLAEGGTSKGDDIGWVLANTAGNAEDKNVIDNGLGEPVVVNGTLTTIKYRQEPRNVPEIDQATGQPTGRTVVQQVPVLDTSQIGAGTPGDQLPVVIVQTGTGPIAVRAVVEQQQYGTFLVANGKVEINGKQYQSGHVFSSTELATLSPQQIRDLTANQSLKEEPWMVDAITMPDSRIKNPGGGGVFAETIIPGSVWYHEPGRSMQEGWHEGKLPVNTLVPSDNPAAPYVGQDEAGAPEIEFKPGDDGYEFPHVRGKGVQNLVSSGVLDQYRTPLEQRLVRDETGELVPAAQNPDLDDSRTAYVSPLQRDLNEITSARDFAILDDQRAAQRAKRAQDAKAAAAQAEAIGRLAGQPTQPEGPSGFGAFDPNILNGSGPVFDSGAVAKQVMDLAGRFGVKTPQQQAEKPRPVNPVLGRNVLRDSLKPKPQPSRGDIPRPTPPAPVPDRAPTPPKPKTFVPPSPVKTIVGATAGIGKQPAKKTYVPPVGGSGFRGF